MIPFSRGRASTPAISTQTAPGSPASPRSNSPRSSPSRSTATPPLRDRRLIVGVALIALSGAGAYFFVTSTQATEDVYVARSTLVAGQAIHSSDLTPVSVNLSSVGDAYVRTGELSDGMVATRTISSGEMIPVSAVGSTATVTAARLVITVDSALADSTAPGTSVDVWATVRDPYSTVASAPTIVVPGATFVKALPADSYASDTSQRIELLVPRASLRALLSAQGDGASLVVVPTVSQAG